MFSKSKNKTLTFAQVVAMEAGNPGLYYRRSDYPAKWCIQFDPKEAGRLKQFTDGRYLPSEDAEMYHHDFDGEWKVTERKYK